MSTDRGVRARLAVPLGALAACACNGETSYLDATGAAGHREAVLGIWLTVVSIVVVLFVCVVILAAIARHRGERNAPANEQGKAERWKIRSGLGWIYSGTVVSFVILVVTFGATAVTLNAASRPERPTHLAMEVIGHQWWWEVRYRDERDPSSEFTTANEVHLPIGEPVRVKLRTEDVIHSFWLPQIAGKMDVIPGQVNETWLEARTPGVSRGLCGEYCGMQHATMGMSVVAESPEAFAAWMQARRAPGTPAVTPETHSGAVVFARSCGACHAIAGTNSLGHVGPDLTHLASRPAIGAGALANTLPNLMRWIRHAPDIKPGTRMPEVPLDDTELRAVVAYLRTLR